jgi:TFIIF-interacting CTD phosphatase-like protein
MSKKINIILDLDECLLHCLVYEVREENYKTFSSYKKQLKQQGFESFSLKYKFDIEKKDDYTIGFIRPHLQTLITYLFKNYNVSVWSNGYYTYVDKICDIIFTKSQRKKLKIIFGARGTLNGNRFVYDIKNKKKVYDFAKYNSNVKDLSHLFKTKPYSTIFNKDNTILIDDSQYHLDYNKHNVLKIHHWVFYEQDDTTLLKIIDFLKSPNIKTNKLPILNKKK